MSCLKDEIIQKYIDGEANRNEIILVENHIANCEECAVRIENQKSLATGVKKAINLLAEDTIEIPKSVKSSVQSKKRIITGRRLLYIASAACILLIVLIIPRKKDIEVQTETIFTHDLDWEYDANKTISQQQMYIHIIDVEGDITKFYVD